MIPLLSAASWRRVLLLRDARHGIQRIAFSNGHSFGELVVLVGFACSLPNILPADAKENQEYIMQTIQMQRLVSAFRFRGHLVADLDPLKMENKGSEIAPDLMKLVKNYPHFDLTAFDMDSIPPDRKFLIPNFNLQGNEFEEPEADDWWTLPALLDHLYKCYASTAAFEISHIPELEQRQWIQHRVENQVRHKRKIAAEEQRQILQVPSSISCCCGWLV
jgi:2-oxoglutarate dehydrogenase complex dehydrogenase (E1) component-like enzyme